jgi:SpoVK/Ycf46/Vps4 family AAA+-type ATPase
MRILPREVDPTVFHMQSTEEEGEGGKKINFSDIGGLNEQIRELREVIELPLTNPELFIRVGIKVSLISSWKIFSIIYTYFDTVAHLMQSPTFTPSP